MLFLVLYILTYWSQVNPPIRDLIAPFATLQTINTLSDTSYQTYSLGLGLLYDCYADYLIGSVHLKYPVLLFSLGHIFKLLAFMLKCYQPIFFLISGVPTNILLFILQLISFKKDHLLSSLFLYTLIVITNLINISLFIGQLSISYLLFAISDMIILIDGFYYRIPYRKIRVLLVPFLYLLSQKLLIDEFKKL